MLYSGISDFSVHLYLIKCIYLEWSNYQIFFKELHDAEIYCTVSFDLDVTIKIFIGGTETQSDL